MFDNVTALSATGSTVATEYVPAILNFDAEKARVSTAQMRERGLDLDMPSLVYHGDRKHVMEYLRSLGWTITGLPRTELFAKHGVPMVAHDNDPLGEITYVSGTYR